MLFRASAPGSLMILGEYAVLEGGFALVGTVSQRMCVYLTPRRDSKIKILSQLGEYEADLSHLTIKEPFHFILTILKKYQLKLINGFDIVIESEFSHQIGFASSAAITVAMLKALHVYLNLDINNELLIQEAKTLIREVQTMGSGADVAACVMGGVVAYRAEPFYVEKLIYDYPMIAVYSGYKTKTRDAISYVHKCFSAQPDILKNILCEIDLCAQKGIQAVKDQDYIKLGKIMDDQQELMQKLNVNTPELASIIETLKDEKSILGAKISGSGLGDCAIGLGEVLEQSSFDLFNNYNQSHFPIRVSQQGVYCEKIQI